MNVSDLKLERYLTGDLPSDEMQELRRREATDEIFRARLQAMRDENAKFWRTIPLAICHPDLMKSIGECPVILAWWLPVCF